MQGRGVRITETQYQLLRELFNQSRFTEYHHLKAQLGPTISLLYINGPTGFGLFGSLSHEHSSDHIGTLEFVRSQTNISTTIIQQDLDWIESTYCKRTMSAILKPASAKTPASVVKQFRTWASTPSGRLMVA